MSPQPFADEHLVKMNSMISETHPVYWPESFSTIYRYYQGKNRVAERSGIPLLNHIVEGLAILHAREDKIGGLTAMVWDAWCIHPIVQDGKEFEALEVLAMPAYELACEYRDKANAYLCRPENDQITMIELAQRMGSMSRGCALLLLADKLQNRFDFERFHKGKHERSAELEAYFEMWLSYLGQYHNLT